MFERFTDRARKVFALANQVAQRRGSKEINDLEILLALLIEGSGVGASVLKQCGVKLRALHDAGEKLFAPVAKEAKVQEKLNRGPNGEKVVLSAIKHSRDLNHNYVGTEHILLALMQDVEFQSAKLLVTFGLSVERLIRETIALTEGETALEFIERVAKVRARLETASCSMFEVGELFTVAKKVLDRRKAPLARELEYIEWVLDGRPANRKPPDLDLVKTKPDSRGKTTLTQLLT